MLCLCNLSSAVPAALSRKVADIYLEKNLRTTTEEPRPEKTSARLAEFPITGAGLGAYAGTYKSTEADATYKLRVEDGGLILRVNWNRPLKLKAIARDTFEATTLGTLAFHRDTNGRISGLSVSAGRIRNVAFEKTN